MKELLELDFNLLKCLDTLLDEQSVSKAACRLGVKQPAMSAALVRLREAFKDPLFVRGHRTMIPTKRALALKIPVKNIVKDIAALLEPPSFDPLTTDGTIAIATCDCILKAIVPQLLHALKAEAPGLGVTLISERSHYLISALESGHVDLALISHQHDSNELHSKQLFEDHYVGVARSNHPIFQREKEISIDEFCDLEHAIVASSNELSICPIDETLRKMGKSRSIRLTANYYTSLLDFLKSSDLVSVLPSRLLSNTAELSSFKLPMTTPTLKVMMAWHQRSESIAMNAWLRAQVLSQFKKI
ncbi:LysR family transcriptional regulator [Pseudomonas sp. CGJS7]|uniref:LysR family transcriptional regulator n=1 Tax=Pseudomonas sp. CGJS7 TaxID=3109348 RepID=UPI00300BF317